MAAVAREEGFDRIEVVSVARYYVTRHGAGPLAGKEERLDFGDVIDPTNVLNERHGTLRFAPLNLDILAATISHGLARVHATAVPILPSVAVTCLDQLGPERAVYAGGKRRVVPAGSLGRMVSAHVGIERLIQAGGPIRTAVKPALQRIGIRQLKPSASMPAPERNAATGDMAEQKGAPS